LKIPPPTYPPEGGGPPFTAHVVFGVQVPKEGPGPPGETPNVSFPPPHNPGKLQPRQGPGGAKGVGGGGKHGCASRRGGNEKTKTKKKPPPPTTGFQRGPNPPQKGGPSFPKKGAGPTGGGAFGSSQGQNLRLRTQKTHTTWPKQTGRTHSGFAGPSGGGKTQKAAWGGGNKQGEN